METINERLAALPDLLKYESAAALAKASGIDPNTLRKAMQGPSKPGFDVLEALMKRHTNISPDWLLLGTGPMLRDGRVHTPVVTEEQTPAKAEGPSTGRELAAYADTLRLIGQMEARIGGLETDKVELREGLSEARTEVRRLRDILISLGKPFDSSDAADDFDGDDNEPYTPKLIAGGATPLPSYLLRVQGLRRYQK